MNNLRILTVVARHGFELVWALRTTYPEKIGTAFSDHFYAFLSSFPMVFNKAFKSLSFEDFIVNTYFKSDKNQNIVQYNLFSFKWKKIILHVLNFQTNTCKFLFELIHFHFKYNPQIVILSALNVIQMNAICKKQK